MATEKRLIDVDVAIERARESDNIVGSSIWETSEVVEFLECCPIEDAVEVVHGHKVTHSRFRGIAYAMECPICNSRFPSNKPYTENVEYCSVCGKKLDDTFQNYCPNCGAKMDGGTKVNEQDSL